MLIQERVKLIIKANNETPSSFADKIGLKRSNLSHVLSGRNKPSLDFLSKIIDNYPKVNASWLITGTTRDGDFQEEQTKSISQVGADASERIIERIVIFYSDGSFKEYKEGLAID
ncbi:MAG TPA: XRE family transcriptional regulator [Crocinitomicaceae bacterium]|nr:XRE family transcriptional regulator [Crocinitomicaceae bacterium]